MLFGDSLTERSFEDGGFGARVQHEFRRFADVRCRGYSGYNTEHALCLLDEVFPLNEDADDDGAFATHKRAPVLVTILFGSNDACAKNSSAGDVQHVPLPRYEQNLKTIVERVRRMQPTPRILFITPPPVDDEAWLRDCATRAAQPGLGFGTLLNDTAPNRTNAGVKPYAEAMKRVARSYDIPVVDLHAALEFSNGEVDETQFCDGLHFSEAGQRQVASLVIDALRQHFPALASRASDAVKCDFPDWKDLDRSRFRRADISPPRRRGAVARRPERSLALFVVSRNSFAYCFSRAFGPPIHAFAPSHANVSASRGFAGTAATTLPHNGGAPDERRATTARGRARARRVDERATQPRACARVDERATRVTLAVVGANRVDAHRTS